MITWAFAIVSQLRILVHLTGSPFSIGWGQTLLPICIPRATRDLSLSFPPQAGPPSSFGIISIWRILHNPSWCSILLCHATFFVERGRVPPPSCLEVMYKRAIPVPSVGKTLPGTECISKSRRSCICRGNGGGLWRQSRLPQGFPPLQFH